MKTGFCIVLNIKTSSGFEPFGKFFLGEDAGAAATLFTHLKGSEEADETDMLQLDFMEMKDELPVNVRMLHCTLDEMTENCKLITKETFKRMNLKS